MGDFIIETPAAAGSSGLDNPTVTEKTTAYTVTTDDSQSVFTNKGAAAQVDFTLPSAAAGLRYTFMVEDADGIKIIAGAGDTISIGIATGIAAGTVECNEIGGSVTLVAVDAVKWVAESHTSHWVFDGYFPTTAWFIDQTNEYIHFSGTSLENVFVGGGTVACWWRQTGLTGSGVGIIWTFPDSASSGSSVNLLVHTAGTNNTKVRVNTDHVTTNGQFDSTIQEIPTYLYNLVIVRWDGLPGSIPEVWVNSHKVDMAATVVSAGDFVAGDGDCFLGGHTTPNNNMVGTMAAFSCWDVQLSRGIINKLMHSSMGLDFATVQRENCLCAVSPGFPSTDDVISPGKITDRSGNTNHGITGNLLAANEVTNYF